MAAAAIVQLYDDHHDACEFLEAAAKQHPTVAELVVRIKPNEHWPDWVIELIRTAHAIAFGKIRAFFYEVYIWLLRLSLEDDFGDSKTLFQAGQRARKMVDLLN